LSTQHTDWQADRLHCHPSIVPLCSSTLGILKMMVFIDCDKKLPIFENWQHFVAGVMYWQHSVVSQKNWQLLSFAPRVLACSSSSMHFLFLSAFLLLA
jgi:hypothetical protein